MILYISLQIPENLLFQFYGVQPWLLNQQLFFLLYFLGERVANLDELQQCEGGTVKTDKETTIEADMVINVTGDKTDPSAYKDGLGLFFLIQIFF